MSGRGTITGVPAADRFERRRSIVALCCAATLLVSVFALAAPSKSEASTPWWSNSRITVSGDAPGVLITVHKNWTELIKAHWRGPGCNVDKNGNSIPGGPMDRAVCALELFRSQCPSGMWPPQSIVAGYICREATHYREWRDLNDVMWKLHTAQPAAPDCLALHVFSTVEGPWNWTSRNISSAECRAS
jgi:hypothetical protein